MVGVAQLVEPWIVIPVVVGSSPIVHPIFYWLCISFDGALRYCFLGPLAQLVEQLTLNQLVVGSSPTWPTNNESPAIAGLFCQCALRLLTISIMLVPMVE